MLKKCVFLLATPYSCPLASAQTSEFTKARPESVGRSTDSLQKMNAYFHKLVDQGKLAGIQTAILRKGKLAQFDSYCYAGSKLQFVNLKQEIINGSIWRH